MSEQDIYSGLQQLGGTTRIPASPADAVLERVANPQADVSYNVRFTAPEFTSLCPMTGQPDFAHLVIDYVPGDWLVESKSLKLYLFSFRNHGAFHEDCTVSIARRLIDFLAPQWLRTAVTGTPGVAFRSTCSISRAKNQPMFGSRIRMFQAIAEEGDLRQRRFRWLSPTQKKYF